LCPSTCDGSGIDSGSGFALGGEDLQIVLALCQVMPMGRLARGHEHRPAKERLRHLQVA